MARKMMAFPIDHFTNIKRMVGPSLGHGDVQSLGKQFVDQIRLLECIYIYICTVNIYIYIIIISP